jgi:hypothetical protein
MKMSFSIDAQLMFPTAFKIGPYKVNGFLMTEIAKAIQLSATPGTCSVSD